MANQLYELDPAEVSLVKKGANKKKFIIFKSAGGKVAKKDKIKKEFPPIKKDGEPEAAAPAAPARTLSDRAKAAIQACVRILTPFKGEVTDADLDQALVANQVLDAGGDNPADAVDKMGKDLVNDPAAHAPAKVNEKKADAEEEDEDEEDEDKEAGLADKNKNPMDKSADSSDHLMKMGNAIKEMVDKYCANPAMSKKGDKDMPQETKKSVIKADGSLDMEQVPEAVRPAVEAIYKTQLELVKKNSELETQLSGERKERREKEFVAKAESFKHYVGDKKELAVKLMKLEDASKEVYTDFIAQLESMDAEKEKVSKSLLTEKGSGLAGPGGSDVDSKIDAAVKSIVQKTEGKLTHAQAYTQFIQTEEGQKMYAEYKTTRKGGI